LLDDALGNDFSLLRLYEDPAEAFSGMTAIKDEMREKLRVRLLCILPANTTPGTNSHPGCTSIVDVEGKIEEFLGGRRDVYVLVRPDRYVMGAIEVRDPYAMSVVSTLQSFIRTFDKS
jgi:3-(3-hydroxy-phenyl)propionate hydroxylase